MRPRLLVLAFALVFLPQAPSAPEDPHPLLPPLIHPPPHTAPPPGLIAARDPKPGNTVPTWTAETAAGDLHRVLTEKGQTLAPAKQREQMDKFIGDTGAQASQRKSGAHDDQQSEEMLRLL